MLGEGDPLSLPHCWMLARACCMGLRAPPGLNSIWFGCRWGSAGSESAMLAHVQSAAPRCAVPGWPAHVAALCGARQRQLQDVPGHQRLSRGLLCQRQGYLLWVHQQPAGAQQMVRRCFQVTASAMSRSSASDDFNLYSEDEI